MVRILVVEDSATQAEVLKVVLEQAGYQTVVARHAEEAIVLLSAGRFDLVVSDIIMNQMSGYDLCRVIRAQPAWKNIPVILLTASDDPMDICHVLECGADNFYIKPYEPDRLIKRIGTILQNKALRGPDREAAVIQMELLGRAFVVGAEKEQILDLLFSTFEETVQANRELKKSRAELMAANEKIEQYADLLEGRFRSSEEKNRAIVDAVSDGILVFDEAGLLQSLNPAAQGIFGYTDREAIGRQVNDFIPDARKFPPDDIERPVALSMVCIAANGPNEVKGRRSNGDTFFAQADFRPAVIGERMSFVGIVRDLTLLKAAEIESRAAEVAKEASQVKSRFLASMSHEIRTPLNGVTASLELLACTDLTFEQTELIDNADKAAKALLTLISNILDFSKIEEGRLSLEISDIDPIRVIEDAIQVLQSKARQKNIFILGTFGPNVPAKVRGDGNRLRQILLNLIGNSLKFTEVGGVHVRLLAVATIEGNPELRFEVHDSGCGFDPAISDRLFQPFSQEEYSSYATEGTGLGLSISKTLVEIFGGAIGCESRPEGGATFWFTMPFRVVSAPAPIPQLDLGGHTILIVKRADISTLWLEKYFEERKAIVKHVSEDCLAAEINSSEANLRVIFAGGSPATFDAEMLRLLARLSVVSFFYTDECSPQTRREALRSSIIAILGSDIGVRFLDRNLSSAAGQRWIRTAPEPRASVEPRPTFTGRRVLILEDNLINQSVIVKQLRKFDLKPVMASNGFIGLEEASSRTFDIILCDCSMPEMNGYEFTREWRRREASERGRGRIPIVALTANAFIEDAQKCYEAGMDDFVTKPISLDRLAEIFNRWLGSLGPEERILLSSNSTFLDDAPASKSLPPPINVKQLADAVGWDSDVVNELIELFSLSVNESLGRVGRALNGDDEEEILCALHSAKGESRSGAAIPLSDVYADMERAVKIGDFADLHALFNVQAIREVKRVQDFISDYLTHAI
jgi:PAS domain S-box-containing protein